MKLRAAGYTTEGEIHGCTFERPEERIACAMRGRTPCKCGIPSIDKLGKE